MKKEQFFVFKLEAGWTLAVNAVSLKDAHDYVKATTRELARKGSTYIGTDDGTLNGPLLAATTEKRRAQIRARFED